MSSNPLRLEHDWFDGSLPAGIRVGERSWIYSTFGFIHCRTGDIEIGDDTGVYAGTMFDLGPGARLRIGNHSTIVGPIVASQRSVSIGDFVLIAHEVVIAGSPFDLPFGPSSSRGGDVEIGDDCWIGAHAILLGPVTLGRGVIVGASSVVTGDIPSFSIVAGNPGRVVGSANR